MLRSAELYAEMKDSESYGIETDGVRLAFDKVQKRKDGIVAQSHQGVQYLMRKIKLPLCRAKGGLSARPFSRAGSGG